MFGNKNKKNEKSKSDNGKNHNRRNPPTIIAADVNILGSIVSEGALDIDGIVDGNVRCKDLIIREGGRIHGDVTAEKLQAHGAIDGMVRAKEVSLHETATVKGSIIHETLGIEDGASIDGQLKKQANVDLDASLAAEDDPTKLLKRFKIIE